MILKNDSKTQKEFILSEAGVHGLKNIEVQTGDITVFDFHPAQSFDRILSIEMFEHMKNYRSLLKKVSGWVVPNGLVFIHIFIRF